MEKKSARKAVVIGVNNYHDPQIPGLSGAVADASEIRQKLKDDCQALSPMQVKYVKN
jgi:hypothetical protein